MSRRDQSLIGQMVEVLVELPIWAAVLTAALVYLILRFAPPLLAGSSMTGKAFSTIGPTIAPWAGIAIVAAGLIGVGKRRWKRHLLSQASDLQAIRQMPWADFELLVGEAYRQQGYSVRERGGRQADGGIDLELARSGERVIVQCKHWLQRPVPVQRVRELLGVVTAEGADRGILVATSGFTLDALQFAAGKPLELIDGEAMAKLVRPSIEATAGANPNASKQAPPCPACGKLMVWRTARRGQKIGSQFWGCSSFPTCRATRAA